MSKRLLVLLVAVASTFSVSVGNVFAGEGWNPLSGATTQGSIINTRHNLTMSYLGAAAQLMDSYRNDYGEICVYCHTPHGANAQVDAPLWNRTINVSQYQVFDKVRTLNQPITQPGPNSLTCLSCHDGTISPDSIINMPGSGRYNKATETVWDPNYLDAWARDYGGKGPIGLGSVGHKRLQKTPSGDSCMACHNPSEVQAGANPAADFTVFAIEEDLRDDHPIGILFPYLYGEALVPGRDFFVPTGTLSGQMDFFDTDGDGYPDKDEVRMYDTGDGPEVECGSCHDPHGVPSGGAKGTRFNPSFLRVNNGVVNDGTAGTAGIVSNTGSALCLTCHDK